MIKSVDQPSGFLGWVDSLADPTRLRALRLLEHHELGVAELCDVLQLPQSTVSRHLKILGSQGWTHVAVAQVLHLWKTPQTAPEDRLVDVGKAAPRHPRCG